MLNVEHCESSEWRAIKAPKLKDQAPEKPRVPNLNFDVWSLNILWRLEVGSWLFPFVPFVAFCSKVRKKLRLFPSLPNSSQGHPTLPKGIPQGRGGRLGQSNQSPNLSRRVQASPGPSSPFSRKKDCLFFMSIIQNRASVLECVTPVPLSAPVWQIHHPNRFCPLYSPPRRPRSRNHGLARTRRRAIRITIAHVCTVR
jgi:hypothetical protein